MRGEILKADLCWTDLVCLSCSAIGRKHFKCIGWEKRRVHKSAVFYARFDVQNGAFYARSWKAQLRMTAYFTPFFYILLWQAIPARKRHHLDAYHLHYAVKYAVKCRKTSKYAVMRKKAPLFTPQLSLSRARVKSAVLNIIPRVKYGAFVHVTTP